MKKETTSELNNLIPQAVKLEEAILGAVMLEREAFPIVSATLHHECFYGSENALIWNAIINLDKQNKPIDMLTVSEQLLKEGKLEDAGGAAYIARLTGNIGSAANVEYHARIVAQKFVAREAIKTAVRLLNASRDQTQDIDDVLTEAERNIIELREKAINGADPKHISFFAKESINKVYDRASKFNGLDVQGVDTGLIDLNRHTNGWQNSELIIIAARPAMGKTAFSLHFAKTAAKKGVPVAFFSLEMSGVSLSNRLILSESGVDPDNFKSGKLSERELNAISDAVVSLFNLPIYVDDMPSTITKIRAKARLMKRQGKCGMVVIDYLQQAESEGNYSSREQEVAFVSKTAKNIAKELDVPVILLSQLNRGVEARNIKRPQLSDLRDSGAIEQDADMVIFLYRPDYYTKKVFTDENGREIPNYIEMDIAKYREGSTGTIRAVHNGTLTRIFDYDWLGQKEYHNMNSYEPIHEQTKPF